MTKRIIETMSHERVLPRDLFNEAKILKCLGRLSLLKHEKSSLPYEVEMDDRFDTDKFIIKQDQNDGWLYVENVRVRCNNVAVEMHIPYYAPDDPYPLYMVYDARDEYEETVVFDNSGNFTAAALASLKHRNDLHGRPYTPGRWIFTSIPYTDAQ